MPLMSAAKLWPTLKGTVADENVFKDITILLLVQVITQIIWCVRTHNRIGFKCVKVILENGMLCPHFECLVSDAVPSLWLCAWRKAKDLLPPLPSSGLRITVNSHRSVCPLSSLFLFQSAR